jgi:hypothetical protein
LFDLYDSDTNHNLSLNELTQLLQKIENKITSLPAVRFSLCPSYYVFSYSKIDGPQTAQVASQQGKYIGRKLTKLARHHKLTGANGLRSVEDEALYRPFKYAHLGSLAYIGNAAVFDMGKFSFMGGLVAMYAWRSVYWSEQVSARTRALLMIDWIIRCVTISFHINRIFKSRDTL